jgi:hypothetical protein
MNRPQSTANKAAFIAAILVFLFTTSCGTSSARNACPIDGQPPQWKGGRKGNSCEYFHYSAIERQTHSWWAECDK